MGVIPALLLLSGWQSFPGLFFPNQALLSASLTTYTHQRQADQVQLSAPPHSSCVTWGEVI